MIAYVCCLIKVLYVLNMYVCGLEVLYVLNMTQLL
jgi:hypothetical protein